MKCLIVDTLTKEERRKYQDMGLYCYDLRDSDFGNDIASIEKHVLVNRIGSILTNKELKFKPYPNDYIDYNSFTLKNKMVDKIEQLLPKKEKTKGR